MGGLYSSKIPSQTPNVVQAIKWAIAQSGDDIDDIK